MILVTGASGFVGAAVVARLAREGIFHPVQIRQKWHDHLSGECNWQYDLWDVLMFQAWLEEAG